jgi:HlyD family secretion protein
MATAHIPAISSRRAWGTLATGALVVGALAAWGARGPAINRASAQEGRTEGSRTSAASPSGAVALARLLPASGLISVGARPGARVVELKVKEGDQVAAGTVLAILEGHDAARSQLALASARKTHAEHERAARLAAAREAAEVTKRRLDEGQVLYKQFGATLKGKDRYDAEMALYQVETQAIRTRLDLELAQGPGASGGSPPSDPKPAASAGPETIILDSQVEMAAAGLRETEVRAPSAGRILRVLVHAGELSPGALLMMGDVSSMIAKAEVYQSDVPRIRPGDTAEVDILGTRVTGQVDRIGSIVGKNQLTSIDPRALRDLRVIEVTIRLDAAAPANRFVDMDVEAVIRPSGASPPTAPRDALPPERPAS